MKYPRQPFISVILASYNDRQIIRPFYDAIIQVLKGQENYAWELIYVDDGSTDGSVQELKKLVLENPKVSFIEFSRNFGQQKAFFAGIRQARGDIVITLDGDFQYDPRCILDLADKLMEGYDLVSGIRVGRRDPFFSRMTSFIGQFFVRQALGYPVKDFGSVKAYSRFLTEKMSLSDNYCVMPHGMAFALTSHIAEIPVAHQPRPSGRSNWTFTKRLHVYFDLLLAYSSYETTQLIRVGMGAVLVGFLTLSILLYLFLARGIFFFHTFTAITAMCLIGGGGSLIFGSFIFSFLLRIYRQLLWKGACYAIRDVHTSHEIKEISNIHVS